MDIFTKINKDVIFTYEIHHGALVSTFKFEIHNRNPILTLDSSNISVLIFALYVYTLIDHHLNLKFNFDVNKYYRSYSQPQVDYYLVRYP